jgi:alkenylglycerophosphocholine/alkenylglycerophosphoethanolamine hydrolase
MRLLWFVPFVVASVLHLGALFASAAGVSGAGELASASKPALMLTLLGGFLAATPRPRGPVAIWACVAIVLSLAGDVLFAQPGDVGFILGLGGFLLAHVAYTILFLGPLRTTGMPRLAALYGLWWFGLLALLLPHLGALAVPVVVYGGVLGLSAASALSTNRTIAVGAALFLLSDTVLACKLFLPGFEFWQQDFAIMVLYCAGQGLIALGVVRFQRDGTTRSRVSELASTTEP